MEKALSVAVERATGNVELMSTRLFQKIGDADFLSMDPLGLLLDYRLSGGGCDCKHPFASHRMFRKADHFWRLKSLLRSRLRDLRCVFLIFDTGNLMNRNPSLAIVGQSAGLIEGWSETASILGFSVETFSDAGIWRVASHGRATCAVVDLEAVCNSATKLPGFATDELPPLIVIADAVPAKWVVETIQRGAVSVVGPDADGAQRATLLSQAVIIAHERSERRRLRARVTAAKEGLSNREKLVLDWIISGRPNKWIAAQMNMSIRTIESDRRRIYDAFDIGSVAELATLLAHGEGFPTSHAAESVATAG